MSLYLALKTLRNLALLLLCMFFAACATTDGETAAVATQTLLASGTASAYPK